MQAPISNEGELGYRGDTTREYAKSKSTIYRLSNCLVMIHALLPLLLQTRNDSFNAKLVRSPTGPSKIKRGTVKRFAKKHNCNRKQKIQG